MSRPSVASFTVMTFVAKLVVLVLLIGLANTATVIAVGLIWLLVVALYESSVDESDL